MNRAERRIRALLRQLAERDFAVLSDLGGSPRRLAILAYVADQHGFRYVEAHRVGRALQIHLVRTEHADTRPPDSASVPGLRPGTLKPLPETAPAVRLFRDRIELDAMAGDLSVRSRAAIVTGCSAFTSLCCLAAGWQATLVCFFCMDAFFMGFLYLHVVRRRRIARRVQAAVPMSG
ncbi:MULTISPECIES: hypothetical protein [unclassified Streptomyces]|uniref:hypothetical protein n=1 Tax=unclassified Streptomyces TaxID=2593676 RepID=UPI002E818185|nr:hypothetical protein [Streptomyces sp. NBC_00589]WTI36834.1 hypothetical protein OIC96_18365 [Streptomyces sp. NBC_00775]WUB29490.1 hypothetical protein OHA51_31370 [Streptomyces sp. NBC_00589]